MRIAVVIAVTVTALLLLSRLLDGSDCYDPHKMARVRIGTLGAKIETFALDTGRLPATLSELVDGPFVDALGAYAHSAELRDPWNAPFYYRPDADGTFALFTLGKDGRIGGEAQDRDLQYESAAEVLQQ